VLAVAAIVVAYVISERRLRCSGRSGTSSSKSAAAATIAASTVSPMGTAIAAAAIARKSKSDKK
jgi:hypothetical protein